MLINPFIHPFLSDNSSAKPLPKPPLWQYLLSKTLLPWPDHLSREKLQIELKIHSIKVISVHARYSPMPVPVPTIALQLATPAQSCLHRLHCLHWLYWVARSRYWLHWCARSRCGVTPSFTKSHAHVTGWRRYSSRDWAINVQVIYLPSCANLLWHQWLKRAKHHKVSNT